MLRNFIFLLPRRLSMSKKLLLFLCCFHAFVACDNTNIPAPEFQESIHLFEQRNLAEIIALKHPDKLSPEVQAWLTSTQALDLLHEASGRPCKRQIGHDENRTAVYSGELLPPATIVVTFSDEESLEKTIESLQKNKLAHNFLIDQDGKIYPITNPNESIEQALTHRAFNVGKSALTLNGFYQERDMNSRSISISVVGKDANVSTESQNQTLVSLINYLNQAYNIPAHQVVDYGCIAYPYGRRKVQTNLPWQLLAQHNLTLWPKEEHYEDISSTMLHDTDAIIWASQALTKIGFICPCTNNAENSDFIAALKTFQQHFQCDNQDGKVSADTLNKINSILIQHEEQHEKLKEIMPPQLKAVIKKQ